MSDLFLSLLSMSLTAGYSILAVLLVRFLLQKAPKKYSYLLWSVVAFRLCCPVSFSSAASLFRLALPGISPSISAGPSTAPADGASLAAFPAALRTFASPRTWLITGTVLWLIGAAALAACGLISYIRLAGKLRTAVRLKDNVFQSEYVQSPFILGLANSKIYIPYHLDSQTLHYILLHENYHIKRCDHILKTAAYLILSLHWFNPLCWLAFHLFCKDMEMSCDEHVLEQDEHTSGGYSDALLSFALRRHFPSPGPLAFGETDIKKRILHILGWKPPRPAAGLLSAALCFAALFVCAANPSADSTSAGLWDEGAAVKNQLPDTEEAIEDEAYSDIPDTDDSARDGLYVDVPDSSMPAENGYDSGNDYFPEYNDFSESHHLESHHSGHHNGE
ncbi:MAG TPA: hypothetical protein DF613_15855 [Lachnospiraceae bacterium]|nr:hypothetical protein [Lachnospiraceae bacterium]